MTRKYLALIFVLTGCRGPLPPPHAPLATTPEASFRSQPPAPSPAKPFNLQVGTATRADGLSVWYVERSDAPTTVFAWANRNAGLLAPHAPGLPEIMMQAQAVRLRGGLTSIRGWSSQSGGTLRVEVLSKDARSAARRFATVVSSPPEYADVETAKRKLRSALRKEAFGATGAGTRVTRAGLFGEGHTLGLPPSELAARAKRVGLSDVQDYWQTHARSGERVMVVVGPDAAARAQDMLKEAAPAPAGASNFKLWTPALSANELRIRVLRMNAMPWVRLTLPLPAAQGHDPLPTLATQVLGSSLTGRLGEALRLSSGHSYALHSGYSAYAGHGELKLSGNVGEGDVPLFLERAQEVIASLAKAPVTERELSVAHGRWRGGLNQALSTRSGTANLLARAFLTDAAVPDFNRQAQALAKVTPAQLQAWAQSALDLKQAQAVVFARAQGILPLKVLGDAEQVVLKPF